MPEPRAKVSAAIVPAVVTLFLLFGGYGIVALVKSARTPPSSPSPTATATASASPVAFLPTPSFEPELEELSIPTPRPDKDADGLPDDLESVYRTSPYNPDTDGDGYLDGLEVINGYDPLKPAPGDKLARAPSGSPAPTPSYTEQFIARSQLPANPQSLLRSENLTKFVEEANSRQTLPEVPEQDLQVVTQSGKAAVTRYLDAISPPQNPKISTISIEDIDKAFQTLVTEKNDAPLRVLVAKLESNVQEFRAAPVPKEALELHQKYVAASTVLKNSTSVLLNYRSDYVGALVAAARIQNLRSIFTEVGAGIEVLDKKYGIT